MMIKTVNCEIITVPLANAIVHGAEETLKKRL